MSEHKKIRNYNLLGGYDYFTPNPWESFARLLFLLGGSLLGSLFAGCFAMFMPGTPNEVKMLISYPIMFIPPMIYARMRSLRNSMFDDGYSLDSENFDKIGILGCAGLAMLSTLALGFAMDMINARMPEMPQWLKTALESMTGGNVILNFICVSVFAPFFEEWLCRGMVLRGLLHCTRKPGKNGELRKGFSPAVAIIISALFFALIHMNPWQAIPAFALGCLFGFVYYKTGSLKLTMLMHFTNNTLALIAGNIDALKYMDTWCDVMSAPAYYGLAALCIVFLVFAIRVFNRIPAEGSQD